MDLLWNLYHAECPDFLRRAADTPPMRRLRDIGMNCGCEYTHFPRFLDLGPYSRYDHSLGTALIIWHFTESREQALAGLFHDVTAPVFAHVVDFLKGDHLQQEATEAGIEPCLAASPEVMALLDNEGIPLADVSDYHRYPLADKAVPALSADRLEYTFGNLLNYGFADLGTIRAMYRDLTVARDETGTPELAFRTPELAAAFAAGALKNSRVYVADEDRFAMQALAELLRLALALGTLTEGALWTTETAVIAALERDPVCGPLWRRFCGFSGLLRSAERQTSGTWLRVDAKKRYIDPLAAGMGRVSSWDAEFRRELEAFRRLDFSCWMQGQ